jgi:ethanolamine utilization microcompartment shell protein EutS
MIESNGAWHELKAESFDEFKADMTFDKQIGGEVNAEVGLGLQNGEAAFGETDIATEGNSLIQEQIDRLEGEVAVHDNQINSNEEQISDATSQAEALITEETALNERSSPELDGTDAVNNASINELDSKKTTDTAKPEDQHLLASYSNENGRVIRDNQIAEV